MYDGHDLQIKKGKYGLYVEWGQNKKSLSCFGNRPIENIEYEDVVRILDQIPKDANNTGVNSGSGIGNDSTMNNNYNNNNYNNTNIVRHLNDNISIRTGKFGDYIFYKNPLMKKPEFFKLKGFKHDYKNCKTSDIMEWINDNHHIY